MVCIMLEGTSRRNSDGIIVHFSQALIISTTFILASYNDFKPFR